MRTGVEDGRGHGKGEERRGEEGRKEGRTGTLEQEQARRREIGNWGGEISVDC